MKIKDVRVSVHRFENSIPLIDKRLEDDYRIICDIQDHKLIVLVVEIGHRREIYR